MRLSNKNKAPLYNFTLTFATLCLIIGCMMSFLNIIKLPVFGKMASTSLILLGGAIYIILYLRGRQIFEYDSDGEALNFKNHSIIPFLGKEAKDEFPKYKLVSFEIVNALLFKRLYIRITSKKHKESILKYDISYLTGNEIRDLKLSLQRTIKANKENKENTDNEK